MAEFSFEEALGTTLGDQVPPEPDEAPKLFSFEEALGQLSTETPPETELFSFEEALLPEQTPAQEPPPVQSNILREAADIPLNLASGVVTGTKLVTDIFGADNPVSRQLSGVEEYIDGLLSAQAKADQQEVARIMQEAEDKGAGAQVRAALRAFATSPLDFAAQGIGTIIPALAAAVYGGTVGVAGYGVGSGVGLVKDAVFSTVNDEMLKQGLSEQEAREIAMQAQSYTGDNLDMIALGGAFGWLASRFGVPETVLKTEFGKRLMRDGLSRGVVRNMVEAAGREGAPEAIQAAQERFAQNLALQREGVDVPLSRGVVGQAALEGIVGGIIGGGVGAVEAQVADTARAEQEAERRALETEGLEVEAQPEEVVDEEVVTDEEGDIETPVWFDAIADEVEADQGQEIDPEKLGRLVAEYGQEAAETYARGVRGEGLTLARTESAPEVDTETDTAEIGGIDTNQDEAAPAQKEEVRDEPTPDDYEAWMAGIETDTQKDLDTIENENIDESLSLAGSTPEQKPKAAAITSGDSIFSTKGDAAGMSPDTARKLSNPDYYRESKGIVSRIETMSPSDYIARVSKDAFPTFSEAEIRAQREELGGVEKIAQAMESGTVFGLPTIEYGVPNRSGVAVQEGLNRAMAAESLGIPEIPVAIFERIVEPKAAEITPDQEQIGLPGIEEAPEAQVGRPPIERAPEATARVNELQRRQDNQRKSEIRTVEKLTNSLDRGVQKILSKKGYVPFFANQEAFNEYDADPDAQYEARVQRRIQSYRILGANPEESARRARRDANKQRTAYNEIQNEIAALQDKTIDQLADVVNIANNSRLEGRAAHTAALRALQDARLTPEMLAEARKRAKAKAPTGIIPLENKTVRSEIVPGEYAPLVPRKEMIDGPIEEVTTAEEAMEVIRSDTNRTDFERGLAALFRPIAKKLATKFQLIENSEQVPDDLLQYWVDENGKQISAGLFDPETNTMYIDSVEGLDARTVLHEMIHASTLDIISSFKAGLLISQEAQAAIDDTLQLMHQVGIQYQNLLASGRASPALQRLAKSTDNFTDLAEFLSYGITEQPLQEMLLNMAPVNKYQLGAIKTAFSNFADLIRRMLGRPTRDISAFEQLIDLTGRIAEEQERTRPKRASQVVQAKKQVEKLSKVQKLQAQQNTLRKFLGQSKGIINAVRDPEKGVRDFLAFADAMDVNTMQGVLGAFTNTMLTKLADGFNMSVVGKLNKTQNELTVYRSKKLDMLSKQVDGWEKYILTNTEGGAILEDLLHFSSVFDVLIYNTKTKRTISLKQSKNTDTTLRGLKFELQEMNKNPSPTNDEIAEMDRLGREIAKREEEIEDVFKIYEELKASKNGATGLEIYAQTLQEYENDLNEQQALLMDNVRKDPNIPGTEQDTKSPKGKLLANIVRDYQEARKLRVYVPLTRPGKYGVRMPGKNGALYPFETRAEANRFIADYMADNPTSPRPQPETFKDPAKSLREQITSDSLRLQEIFKQIDDIQTLGEEGVNTLKDTIYQMYLLSLPEGNVRRAYIRRKNRAGFSNDALRAFITTKLANINQTSRAKYSRVIRNQISEGRAQIEGEQRDQPTIVGETARDVQKRYKEFEKKNAVLNEVSLRATNELSPPKLNDVESVLDYASRAGTKTGFLFLLSSMRSAIIQPTQLAIFGYGTLHAEYGAAKTSLMAGKYMKNFMTFRGLGSTDSGENGEILDERGEPAIRNSKYVKGSPIKNALQKAWDYADMRNIFIATRIHDITGRAEPEESAIRATGSRTRMRASRATKFTYSVMTGALHHLERTSREVFYMSAFELEYEKQLKAGVTGDAAIEAAAEKAIKLTFEGMFDYSSYNKPRYAKQWWGRMAYQFKSYQFQALGYIVQNFYKAYAASGLTREEKKKAATKFWDTMGMGFVFGGTTGMFGYTAAVAFMDGLREFLRPDYDDEDADYFYDVDDAGNPLGLRSIDLYIRNNLIPRYFGAESGLAQQFGLEPETAELLSRAVELGPISALTDWNAQPSLALDGLWFRDSVPRETTEDAWVNGMFDFTLGAFGGVARNTARGFDFMLEGDVMRGFETMAPGFIKEPMEALRLGTQGFKTRDGITEIRPADYYDAWKLLGQTIGFGSTEVAESQESTFILKRLQAERTEARNSLYQDYAEVADKVVEANMSAGAESEEAKKATAELLDMQKEVAKYNYMYFYDAISPEDLERSVTTRMKRAAISTDGLFLNSKEAPYMYPIIKDSRSDPVPNRLPAIPD